MASKWSPSNTVLFPKREIFNLHVCLVLLISYVYTLPLTDCSKQEFFSLKSSHVMHILLGETGGSITAQEGNKPGKGAEMSFQSGGDEVKTWR